MRASPEHVIVLAPGPIEADGRFADYQNGVYVGGQVRMEAAAQLAHDHPSVNLTLVGGYNKIGEGNPDTSKKVTDMARFILARVPEARVRPVFSLPCTRHNFVAVFNRWAQDNTETQDVGILTNAYHQPRALELAQRASAETGRDGPIHFTPIVAEDLVGLPVDGDESAYVARLIMEAKGLADARGETYYRQLPDE